MDGIHLFILPAANWLYIDIDKYIYIYEIYLRTAIFIHNDLI